MKAKLIECDISKYRIEKNVEINVIEMTAFFCPFEMSSFENVQGSCTRSSYSNPMNPMIYT